MNATHLDPDPVPNLPTATAPSSDPTAESSESVSSFADAFNENGQAVLAADVEDMQESDGYAKTFDFDEDRHSDNQDQEDFVEQLDPYLLDASSATAPHAELVPTVLPVESASSAEPIRIANHGENGTVDPSNNGVAVGDPDVQMQTHTVPIPAQDPAEGGIDIQQLLDNITASAESKAASAASAVSSTHSPIPSLPIHASLPPRPQITQQPALPHNPQSDESRRFPTSSLSQAQATTYGPPPGVISPIAGAPGTEGRNGLLPPPPALGGTAISNQPSTNQSNESQPTKFVDLLDGSADDEKPWGAQIQKLYDDFLADERGYVTEGAWDKFPTGSRLFIGQSAVIVSWLAKLMWSQVTFLQKKLRSAISSMCSISMADLLRCPLSKHMGLSSFMMPHLVTGLFRPNKVKR